MSIKRYSSLIASIVLATTLVACSDSTEDEDQPAGSGVTDEAPTGPTGDDGSTEDNPNMGEDETTPGENSPDPTDPAETATSRDEATEPGDWTIPTDAVDYADALVIAWGNGNTATTEVLATPEVLQVLGDMGGPSWDRTMSDSGAGSVFVSYENFEDGSVLELRVQNEAASLGEEHAVVEAKFAE